MSGPAGPLDFDAFPAAKDAARTISRYAFPPPRSTSYPLKGSQQHSTGGRSGSLGEA